MVIRVIISRMKRERETDWLIEKGLTVLVPDLPGTGEPGGGAYIGNVSYNMWYTAMQTGKSIVGIQTSDVIKHTHILNKKIRD